MNLEFKRKLPTLQEIKAMYPIDEQLASQKKRETSHSKTFSRERTTDLFW